MLQNAEKTNDQLRMNLLRRHNERSKYDARLTDHQFRKERSLSLCFSSKKIYLSIHYIYYIYSVSLMKLPIARKFSFQERSQISHKNDVEIRLRLYLQKDFPPHVFEEPSPQIPHLSCPVHLEQEYLNQIMTFCSAGFFFF